MTPQRALAHRYVAFLRAINVGGHVVKMDRLRAEFEALKLRDVETFIASGNVLFTAADDNAAALEQRIERRLEQTFGYGVATFLRTPEELAAIVANEPFADRETGAILWVGFLKSSVPAEHRDRLLALRSDANDFLTRDREAYWLRRVTPDMKVLATGAKLEKSLGGPVTFRNVTTVRKLALKTSSAS
jgi:uncharacterized protein (DUF1697 family)